MNESVSFDQTSIPRDMVVDPVPCPACYRDVRPAPRGTYCARCISSGAAMRHVARRRTAAVAAKTVVPNGDKRGLTNRQGSTRQGVGPAPAASGGEATASASYPARGGAGHESLPPNPQPERERQPAAESPRVKGNRTQPGAAVSEQTPARDAVLAIRSTPGQWVRVRDYEKPHRVKAAIYYLRHQCDLPTGFSYRRVGSILEACYGTPPAEAAPSIGTPQPRRRSGRPAKTERNRALIADFVAGMSHRDLAAKYEVSQSTVQALISEKASPEEKHAAWQAREARDAARQFARAARVALGRGVTAQDAMRVLVRAIAEHAHDEAAAA